LAARRRVVDVLEEKLALDPDAFADRLGEAVRYPVIRMEELRRAAPAFDILPFGECNQRGCALLRNADGALLLVTDAPFSSELAAWAGERIAAPFSWRLAHRGDLVAFLASHEETLRALDAVEAAIPGGDGEREKAED